MSLGELGLGVCDTVDGNGRPVSQKIGEILLAVLNGKPRSGLVEEPVR